MKIIDARNLLLDALLRAVEEHGSPNSFAPGELHAHHGGPPPMLAGRASLEWRDWLRCVWLNHGFVITFNRGRIFVEELLPGLDWTEARLRAYREHAGDLWTDYSRRMLGPLSHRGCIPHRRSASGPGGVRRARGAVPWNVMRDAPS